MSVGCVGLVAGQVLSGEGILGITHGRHIGEQGGTCPHQLRKLGGRLHLCHEPLVFLLGFPSLPQFFVDALPFFRNVGNEYEIDTAVGLGIGKVAIIVHPADPAIPANNAILHIVHALAALFDLLADGAGDFPIVIGVHHPLEGIARQLLEVCEIPTAENVEYRLIGVENLLGLLSLIDEESPGHMTADFLHHLESLAAQLIIAVKHEHSSLLSLNPMTSNQVYIHYKTIMQIFLQSKYSGIRAGFWPTLAK